MHKQIFQLQRPKGYNFLLVQIQIDFHLSIKYQHIETKIIEKHEMVNNSSNKMIKWLQGTSLIFIYTKN